MFVRALIAFLLLPGIVAFLIPVIWLLYTGHVYLIHPYGLVLLAPGLFGLLWCVRDFYVAGKGTLAPWAPTKRLVSVGLYRYSRNPMYISVVLILLGWASSFGSSILYIYALVVFTVFHLRVVYGEEPWLAQVHGSEWEHYINKVPRWF